ncbi:MAG: tetratricopeptide repeat protein [Clostridiales bacterium]|nr:tetratricopeptide repeat protein [Clostridiales bacterium]
MERELVLQILGIRELQDERSVKAAYMEKLKAANPEDDPEGFRRLREAYEEAQRLLRLSEEEDQEKEKTETALWIDRVDEVYRDFRLRRDVGAWKKLFEDPVCRNLDTALEARDALIQYLLSNFYLPMEIWQCLNREFQLVDDKEQLKERYPEDFLNYVQHYTENEYFVDFGKMRLRSGETSVEAVNVDGYIRAYMELRRKCGDGEWQEAERLLTELEAYGVYYYWEDVDRLQVLEAQGHIREALELVDDLLKNHEDSPYAVAKAANVLWNVGQREEAFGWWQKARDNYEARVGIIRYYLEDGQDPEKAKEEALDLMEEFGQNEQVSGYMKQANDQLIRQYEEQLKETADEEKRAEIKVEMAWCCFQNRDTEAARDLLETIEPSEDLSYSYHNLKGRVLAALQQYPEALPELQLWLNMILDTEDDGSAEAGRRLRRRGTAYFMLGYSCSQVGRLEEAVELLQKGVEEITDAAEQLGCMTCLAETYLEREEYEKAVDICDRIIEKDQNYYPAYVNRQKAYYELKRAQEVVDDYHRAVEIYASYHGPYLLAEKVFFFYSQYENAKEVIDRAKENEVEFSDEMKLYEIKVLRNLAQSPEDRRLPLQLCDELRQSMNPDATDIEDVSELDFETALLWWDDNELGTAMKHLKEAIRRNPSRQQYLMVKGEICRGQGEYKEALRTYLLAAEEYAGTPGYHYGIGCCCRELGEDERALKHFLRAAELDEEYRDVNEKIADIYMDRYNNWADPEDFDRAVRYMDQVVGQWESCYTYVHRGLMYMDAMRLPEAIADFEKALTFSPDDWAAYNNMGYCYKHMSQFEKSIQMYEKALEMLRKKNQKSVLPYSNMADCYEIRREYQKAIECYEKDLEWYPNRTSFYREIGDLYRYQHKYEKAIEYYELFGVESRQKISKWILDKGETLFAQGKPLQAKLAFRKVVRDDAEDVYECCNDYAADLMALFFDFKEALRILEKAAASYEKGVWKAGITDRAVNEKLQARACYLMGRPETAAEHARQALVLYLKNFASEEDYIAYPPVRPWRLCQIGECYLYMGYKEKALELFEDMTKGYRCRHCRNKACYEGYRNIGLLYRDPKDPDLKKALEQYEKALEISPEDLELQETVKKLRKEIGR